MICESCYKDSDGKKIDLVFNTKTGENIIESTSVEETTLRIKIKNGKSSLRIRDKQEKGVGISINSIGVSVKGVPIPAGIARTLILGNTLKSVKAFGIPIIKEEPLSIPENLKQ